MKFDTLWRDPSTEAEWLHWRTTCLTSTEVPALFGMSPYLTEFDDPKPAPLSERAGHA